MLWRQVLSLLCRIDAMAVVALYEDVVSIHNATSKPIQLVWVDDINTVLYWLGNVSIGLALLVWGLACCCAGQARGGPRVSPRCTRFMCVCHPPYFILFAFWLFAVLCDVVSCLWFDRLKTVWVECFGAHRTHGLDFCPVRFSRHVLFYLLSCMLSSRVML